jgi:hypothetical protein
MSHLAGWLWTIVVLQVMLAIPAKSYRMLLLIHARGCTMEG